MPCWGGEVDCCINAYALANGTWLGAGVTSLPGWFVEHQLDDGGWNCEWVWGATRSSFRSTINSQVGLLAHDWATGSESVRQTRKRGEEYPLSRRTRASQTRSTWYGRQAGRQRVGEPARVRRCGVVPPIPAEQASKGLTLYGTRVLPWWDEDR